MNDNIIAYIGTIWNDIQSMNESEIRNLIEADIKLMDEEEAAYTQAHINEIVEEAVKEIEA